MTHPIYVLQDLIESSDKFSMEKLGHDRLLVSAYGTSYTIFMQDGLEQGLIKASISLRAFEMAKTLYGHKS